MRTIIVDDEVLALQLFQMECETISELQLVAAFESPLAALEYVKQNPIDLAILDIELPEMNGIELGQRLKNIDPAIVLIYISAHDEYAMQAYRLHAPVYLEKPYNREDILYAVYTAKLLHRRQAKKYLPGRLDASTCMSMKSWCIFPTRNRRNSWPTWWTAGGTL